MWKHNYLKNVILKKADVKKKLNILENIFSEQNINYKKIFKCNIYRQTMKNI